MKEAADVLAESREYLEEHGWCRGTMQDFCGHVCAMGAICYSQDWVGKTLTPFEMGLFKTVCEAVITEITKSYVGKYQVFPMAIPDWNDRFVTGQRAVLDVFMAAEKQLRSGNVEES